MDRVAMTIDPGARSTFHPINIRPCVQSWQQVSACHLPPSSCATPALSVSPTTASGISRGESHQHHRPQSCSCVSKTSASSTTITIQRRLTSSSKRQSFLVDRCQRVSGSLRTLACRDSRGLGVLTPDSQSPVVSQTSVRPDLLQSLKVISHLLVDSVGQGVRVLSVGEVFLSVQEPAWDLELGWVLHDGNDSLELIGVELSGTGISGVPLGMTICRAPRGFPSIGVESDIHDMTTKHAAESTLARPR